jgi:Glycosyltransferase family 87
VPPATQLPVPSWLARGRSYQPFILAVVAYLVLVQLGVCVLSTPTALRGAADFRQLYSAGYMVRSGHAHELYDYEASGRFQDALVSATGGTLPFNHLAYEALLFAPFSWLGFRLAYIAFLVVNLALLALCFGMLRSRLRPLETVWIGLPAVPFLCFYPVTVALIQGQDSILMLALMVAALVSLESGHPYRAGIFVGLTAFKFQFTLPVLFLFLTWRWWRAAVGCGLTAVGLGSLSIYISGTREFAGYLRSLVSMSAGVQSGAQRQVWAIYPEAMPNLRGLLSVVVGRHGAPGLTQWLIVALSVLLLGWVASRRASFPLALVASVLVSYHGLIHDATLLLIPVGLWSAGSMDLSRRFGRWTMALAAVILATPTLLLVSGSWFCLLAIPVLVSLVVGDRWQSDSAERPSLAPIGGESVTKANHQEASKCQQRGTLFTRKAGRAGAQRGACEKYRVIRILSGRHFADRVALQMLTVW